MIAFGLLAACQVLRADVSLPPANPLEPIVINGRQANRWEQGAYEVWLLRGCSIAQGGFRATSGEAVLWIDRAQAFTGRPSKVIAYLERDVQIERSVGPGPDEAPPQRLLDRSWFGRLYTVGEVRVHAPVVGGEPQIKPGVFQSGLAARNPVQPAQFTQTPFGPFAEDGVAVTGPTRTLSVRPRSSVPLQSSIRNFPERNESIALVTSGVRITISDGGGAAQANPLQPNPLQANPFAAGQLGTVELETDRIVAWTSNLQAFSLMGENQVQPSTMPLEFYLEGNIIFRQGDRVIYAERMYYDVPNRRGVVLDAEMLTPAPGLQGLLRLKARVLRQVDQQNFVAQDAALTSSRMGTPKYWIETDQLDVRDTPRPKTDPVTGQVVLDPRTGQPEIEHDLHATSRGNAIYVGSFPVFTWPRLATDLDKPSFYLEGLKFRNDNVFGTQIYTDWNLHQLLGIDAPRGIDWTGSLDYLSDRGPAVGTNVTYQRDAFLGLPGRTRGLLDAWGIKDEGVDNLGADRQALIPEEEYRGRLLWQHRQSLRGGFQLTAEAGLISDRNFLEQYFENEWDLNKDQTTGVELKRYAGHNSLSLTADARLNDFFTQTEWLPRLDHFMMGQSLGGLASWHVHSQVGYAHLRTADAPLDPVDAAKFDPLAWEADAEGVVASTRQEIEIPLQLGPIKASPYISGEVGYWGEDLAGNEVTRLVGQAGIRASLPFWAVNPAVRSTLFNLNGMAHKVSLETDFFYADADQDLSRLPLYHELDDDSIEFFRRRFFFDTFGGVGGVGMNVPLKFDERYFALRSGMQSWVAAPSTEIADDLMVARVGVRQRWQTKRGAPDNQRIVDWITLDVQASLFPEADRDNFGADAGLADYDFRWHLGDRVTLLSDGFFDFFGDGLRMVTFGSLLTRPERGSAYFGYRSIQGPIASDALIATLNYRMSEKWILTAGTSFDLGNTGNIGQQLALTRVGESALVRIGFNFDRSRDNVGVQFAIEPRFLAGSRLGSVGGVSIPPVGARGVE